MPRIRPEFVSKIVANSLPAKFKALLLISWEQQGWVACQLRIGVVVACSRGNLLVGSLVKQDVCTLLGS